MADDGEDLVSNVKVTGVAEATAQLDAFGEKGAAAFDKINASAKANAAGVTDAAGKVQQGAKDSADAMGKVDGAIKPNGPSQKALNQLSQEASDLSRSVVKTSRDVAQFVTRLAAIATVGAVAIAGIAKLGASVAAQVNQTTSAFDQNNAAQQRAVTQNLSAEQAAIQYANQQQQLNRQLATGAIDYDTYSTTLKSNQQAYKDQIRVTAQLQSAEESARIETEQLQKAAADHKAFDDLTNTFGGALTSSLIQLGNTAIAAKNQFVQAFGPGAAAFVDVLTQTLNSNGQAISNFFSTASVQIQEFIKTNGPAIQKAFESIGKAGAAIFNGVITAAPQLLSIFNNQIVPACKALSTAADKVTQSFNFLFGTNLSTGALVIIGVLGSMTGAFKTLLGVTGLFVNGAKVISLTLTELGFAITPLGVAVLAIAAAFIVLNTDWTAFGNNLLIIWASIKSAFSSAGDTLISPFRTAWEAIKAGWDALIQGIIDAWGKVTNFFTTLPDTIGQIFTSIGTSILNAFTKAFDAVKAYIQSWVEPIKAFLKPIIDMINTIASGPGGSGDSNGDSTPAFAGGGHVRGPGTSTSDSILAWLSNNEFVMKAKAVRKYGTSFMRAINEGHLDPSKLMGFAAGGLVNGMAPSRISLPSLTPSFSQAKAAMSLSLSIGGEQFDNLVVTDEETAGRLTRYAINKQSRSAGRRPSWSGGR